MKIIIVFISKNDNNQRCIELSEENFVSFDKDEDWRILHVVIINDQFRIFKNFKWSCAFHMDWCIENLIGTWGKEMFEQ